jgi:uncharacterized protein
MFSRIPIEEQIAVIAQIKKELNTKQNGKLLYLTISGSDLYGFPSQNSDVDYRGAYITGTHNLLGIRRISDVVELKPDIVLFEVKKEIGLALESNCNVLEHLNAPAIYKTPESMDLTRLLNNSITKEGVYNSYRGMAMFNYKKFILQGKKSYKKYLYVFRGLMAGIYVLQTGKIQSNINELNQYFKIPEITHLVKCKTDGLEESEVEDLKNSGTLDDLIEPLLKRLDSAYEKTKMPSIKDRDDTEINSYLIKLRIQTLALEFNE